MRPEKLFILTLALVLGWFLALVMVLGCARTASTPPLYPVSGRILLAGGTPLACGTVVFEPVAAPGLLAVGRIQPDGTFRLETPSLRVAGAVAGEHHVAVFIDGNVPRGRSPIPVAYTDPESSGWIVTIRPGINQLPPLTFQARPRRRH